MPFRLKRLFSLLPTDPQITPVTRSNHGSLRWRPNRQTLSLDARPRPRLHDPAPIARSQRGARLRQSGLIGLQGRQRGASEEVRHVEDINNNRPIIIHVSRHRSSRELIIIADTARY